jgi:hypothetical protein
MLIVSSAAFEAPYMILRAAMIFHISGSTKQGDPRTVPRRLGGTSGFRGCLPGVSLGLRPGEGLWHSAMFCCHLPPIWAPT